MLRKIKASAIFHQIETSTDSAGFTTESNIAWDVQHLVLLAKNRLCTDELDVAAEIIDEAASYVAPGFVDVIVLESERASVISSEQGSLEDERFHHARDPTLVIEVWLPESASNNYCGVGSFRTSDGVRELIIEPENVGLGISSVRKVKVLDEIHLQDP
jgi:hypothetical protein